jgi:hypothetical protein
VRSFILAAAFALALGLSGTALAGQTPERGASLYTVDLATGRLSMVGPIGNGANVVDIALREDGDSRLAYALTADNRLLTFDPASPTRIGRELAISGLAAGDTLVGIDFRPATGALYGLGDSSRLYIVDAETGNAGAPATPFMPALDGVAFGFDFNPAVDRIRVVSDSGQNLRLNPATMQIGTNPDTGAPTIDGRLAYAAGDVNAGRAPAAAAAGYTNNVAGAEKTQLFVIDAAQDVLALQDPPNEGVLKTVGGLGVDVNRLAGFDIGPSGVAYAAVSPALFMPNTGSGTVGQAGAKMIPMMALVVVAGAAVGLRRWRVSLV